MIHYEGMLVVLLFIQKSIILLHSMAFNRKRTMSQTNLQFLLTDWINIYVTLPTNVIQHKNLLGFPLKLFKQ